MLFVIMVCIHTFCTPRKDGRYHPHATTEGDAGRNMILIGIDQGTNGAICIYDAASKVVKFKNTRHKDSDVVQYEYMRNLLLDAVNVRDSIRVTIEILAVFAGVTTPNTAFSMGRVQGITEAAVQAAREYAQDNGQRCEVRWVRPAVWKRQMGLIGKAKQQSKTLAYAKAEALGVQLPKVMRHDAAEAFLLAIL